MLLRYYIIVVFLAVYAGTTIVGAPFVGAYQSIKKKKLIIVGVSQYAPPLNLGNDGVEIRMAKEIAKFLGVDLKLRATDFSQHIPLLLKGKIDIIIAGLSKNLDRAKLIWFSKPYYLTHNAFLLAKRILPQENYGESFEVPSSYSQVLSSLRSVPIGVKIGSVYANHPLETKKIFYKNYAEMKILLERGDIMGLLHDSVVLEYLLKNNPYMHRQFTLIVASDQKQELCIGLPFAATVLKNQLDLWVDHALKNQKIARWIQSAQSN